MVADVQFFLGGLGQLLALCLTPEMATMDGPGGNVFCLAYQGGDGRAYLYADRITRGGEDARVG